MPAGASIAISGWPSRASAADATRRISSLRIRPSRDGSMPSRMFSPTDRCGAIESSWWIIATPAVRAPSGSRRTVRRSVEPHRAGVGAKRAGEDRHQRALARAVLADDRADLAGIDEQIDAVDSERRAERLPDPAHLEARSGRRSCSVVSYGFFSHRSRSGLRSSAASGEFMSARETTRTPVSMRRSTFCPLMWSTIVFTPR